MKYSKLFLTGCMVAFAMNASAQDETTTIETVDSAAVIEPSHKADYDHGYHIMPEIKLGICDGVFGYGANIVLEHEFHPYLAWDIVSLDVSAPYDFSEGNFGIKTGLRGFTPRFWNNKARGFLSVAAGYECCVTEVATWNPLKVWYRPTSSPNAGERVTGGFDLNREAVHGLGVSVGIGLQIKKHIFVGYTLEYSTPTKNTSHYARFGYRF